MMEKRKRAKNTQSYDEINRQVKQACKIAKENCQELENLEKQHLTRNEKIRRVTNRRKTTQTTGIMDKHDNMCFEKETLVNVWIEYMGELYADDRVTRPEINDASGPSITSTEVKHAIKKLKNNKATGTDLIAAEMLKALEDGPLGKLTQLCNEIYDTGYWPKELKESIFIPIPKKPKATRCQEYRRISIMSQVTKLLLNIVMDRMKGKIEAELDDAQSGFRQGKGTREGLLNLRLISSRLDYCNSLLNNIAKQDLSKLKRVQNCLARVVLRAPRFSPSLPLLKQLHWLPVNYRIKFKLSTLTYRAIPIHQPPYLASLLHFSNIPRQFRSSTSQQLSIPRTKLNLGKRAFSVAARIIWHELPTTLKSCESLASFRKHLKTYLFKIAFPP